MAENRTACRIHDEWERTRYRRAERLLPEWERQDGRAAPQLRVECERAEQVFHEWQGLDDRAEQLFAQWELQRPLDDRLLGMLAAPASAYDA